MANIKTNRSGNASAAANRGEVPVRGRGRPREFDRDAALDKAMLVFWARGYEATTMADLRSELQLTQASIYAAFGGKEQLFREALALYQQTSGATTAHALEQPGTAREAIESMLRDAARVFTTGRNPAGCMVVLGAIHSSQEGRAVQQRLQSLRLLTPERILGRLQRGQREGDLGPGAPVRQMAEYFTTLLHGLSIQARDGASRRKLGDVIDCAMRTWDGLAGGAADSARS